MQKNKFNQPPVRADLSRPAPIMQMNKIIRTSVGADLSCPSPIYRPSADVSISGLFCETSLLLPGIGSEMYPEISLDTLAAAGGERFGTSIRRKRSKKWKK